MSNFVQYRKQSSLPSFTIELTERCNNDCIHCCINLPAGDRKARCAEMSTSQVEQVLQQAADLGFGRVHLTGGEPLLCSDFEQIYLFARRLGLEVLLFTNACLITSRLADLFAYIPPRVPIEITVYGMCMESYEATTRAPGSFYQFMRGIRLLWDRGIPFIVKSAILPTNRSELELFEAGPPGIPWTLARPTYSMNFDLRSRRDSDKKNDEIVALRSSPQDIIAVALRDPERFRPWTEALAVEKLRPPGDRLFQCHACQGKTACVDAYGVAQPCIALREPQVCYPLFDADAVHSSRETVADVADSLQRAITFFIQFRDLRATNTMYLQRCARCFLKKICEQCPAKSWVEYGTFDHPVEYLCNMTHSLVRHFGWLGETEYGWEIDGWHGRIPTA